MLGHNLPYTETLKNKRPKFLWTVQLKTDNFKDITHYTCIYRHLI